MFKKIKVVLSIILSLSLILTVGLSCINTTATTTDEFWYKTIDFEDNDIGDGLPEPFYINSGDSEGKHSVVSDTEQGNYLKAVDDSTSLRTSTVLEFIDMSGKFEFTLKLKFDKCANSTLGFSNQYSSPFTEYHAVGFYFYADGKIFAKDGNTNVTLVNSGADTAYSRGEWVTVRFVIDVSAKTWDVYYNEGETDAASLEGLNFRNKNHGYLDRFGIGPFANQQTTYYLDDITVPTDEEAPKTVDRYIPEYNKFEMLYDGDTATPETDEYYTHSYSAFPTLLHLSDEKVMVVFKRGIGHAYAEAHDDIIIYNPITEQIVSHEVLYNEPGRNPQNPEIAMMPNGDIVVYLDRQTEEYNFDSVGVRLLRSTDGGATWKLDPGNTEDEATNNDDYALLQDTDGVQYFSTYDDAVVGDTIYELAITGGSHGNTLPGYDKYNNGAAAVHVIKSTDNGYTWEHVMDVTAACGTSINESSLEPLDDGGFFFVCRGYDEKTTIFTTDADFNITKKSIVSDEYSCIQYIGRPKIFKKDGEYYLVCRNVPQGGKEELAFYKFDVENLVPETYVIIDDTPTTARAGNGHYSEPFFVERDGVEYIDFISYTNAYTCNPDIVRYELKWDEVKDPVIKTPVEEKTVTVAVPVAEEQSWNNAVVPIYDTELSNLSASFEYTAINDAVWYFDVVDNDYSNCYSLNLTAGGMTLNRTVAGETTALATYSGFEKGKYYEIQLVRYMEDITVFVDGVKAMTVAEEDAAYPVKTTGADTHWRGKLYLDDAKGSVTNIKVYDSGLITFENGYAVLGNIALSNSISSLHAISTVDGVETVGVGTVSSTKDSVTASYSGGNPDVYTTGWLNEDVGDFVLTYDECHTRWDWTAKALLLSATAKENPTGGQWIQYSNASNGVKDVFNSGDAIITGVNQYETNNRYFNITDGAITNDTGALGVGTIYSNVNIKAVKKAERLTVTIGNDVIGYKTVYDGVSNNIVGNIFTAQYQGKINAKNIKVTDTVNTQEIVIVDNTYIAGDLTENGNLNSDDLVLMRKNLLKSYIPKAQKLADVNIDKKVDVKDLVNLKKQISN